MDLATRLEKKASEFLCDVCQLLASIYMLLVFSLDLGEINSHLCFLVIGLPLPVIRNHGGSLRQSLLEQVFIFCFSQSQ